MRVLGFDPGIENFAYSVYETDDGSVVASGWVRGHRINENDWRFLDSVVSVLDEYRPALVGCERFMFRDKASVISEDVNHMIGKLHLLARMRGYEIVLVMPAHWKQKFQVKSLPGEAKGLFPNTKFEAVHQADAAGIAKYVYERKRDRAVAEEEKAAKAVTKAEKKAAKAEKAFTKSVRKRQRAATPETD